MEFIEERKQSKGATSSWMAFEVCCGPIKVGSMIMRWKQIASTFRVARRHEQTDSFNLVARSLLVIAAEHYSSVLVNVPRSIHTS